MSHTKHRKEEQEMKKGNTLSSETAEIVSQVYFELVDNLALENVDAEIDSAGIEESKYVFVKLFENTSKEILILNSGFTGEISNDLDYYYAVRNCLLSGVKIKSLLLEKPKSDSQLMKLFKTFSKQISFRIVSDEMKIKLNGMFEGYEDICHFATFDDNMYRFEKNTKDYLSVSNFNDFRVNGELRDVFKYVWKTSTDFQL